MNTETQDYNYTGYSSTGSNHQSDLKKVLIGALAGVAVGSLIGGLYTEKGIEARTRVSQGGRKIANDIKEKASDLTEGIKDKVSNVTTPIVDKYQSTKKAATKLFAKGKSDKSTSHFQGNYSSTDDDVEISKTKVILSLLALALAGAATWSFTTPKGKETRKRLAQSSKDVAGTIKVKATKLAGELKEAYEDAKEGSEQLMEIQRQRGVSGTTSDNGYNSSTSSLNTFPS